MAPQAEAIGHDELGDDHALFTGDAPRSRRARANLSDALSALGLDANKAKEVDLLKDPQAALDHGIFATPALMVDHGEGEPSVMYGDLSETDRLHQFVGQVYQVD